MRTLTALALIVASSSLAFATPKPKAQNESFIGQVGDNNAALVFQDAEHSKDKNRQATFQKGDGNFALTSQIANPSGGPGSNNSLTLQFDGGKGKDQGNTSLVFQKTNGGSNNQFTIQDGKDNFALTSQHSSSSVSNSSVTAQFGNNNSALTFQHH
jgi:hypothetical protein